MPELVVSTEIDRWRELARALANSESTYTVPLDVLFGEAIDVARFSGEFWRTVREGSTVVRRGLDTVEGKPGTLLHEKIGDDIVSLRRAAGDAHTNYLLEVDNVPGSPMPRALEVLGEIRATLAYLLDDEVEDEDDERLAKLEEKHADTLTTMDKVAIALDNFAGFAETLRAQMDGLGGFSAATIDEARTLAVALRERPAVPATQTDSAREALDLRDRLISLLYTRMSVVRAAGRFVFRDRPEIVRQVTSAYERRRRAARRRAATNAPEPALAAEAAKKPEREPVGE